MELTPGIGMLSDPSRSGPERLRDDILRVIGSEPSGNLTQQKMLAIGFLVADMPMEDVKTAIDSGLCEVETYWRYIRSYKTNHNSPSTGRRSATPPRLLCDGILHEHTIQSLQSGESVDIPKVPDLSKWIDDALNIGELTYLHDPFGSARLVRAQRRKRDGKLGYLILESGNEKFYEMDRSKLQSDYAAKALPSWRKKIARYEMELARAKTFI